MSKKPSADTTTIVRPEGDVSDEKVETMNLDGDGMPSPQQEEAAIKKKYGGIVPRKPPLISKDHERAYFDSADWALGKQVGHPQKPKGPLEALRPKLQPTQQQTRSRRFPCVSAENEEGVSSPTEGASQNQDCAEGKEQGMSTTQNQDCTEGKEQGMAMTQTQNQDYTEAKDKE